MEIFFADLSIKRKIEKNREKVLRCDSVLQRNPFIKAIPSSVQNKKKSKKKSKAVPTAEGDDAALDGHQVSCVEFASRVIVRVNS